jgi:phosphoadenosine phosphosulfate reductase
VTGEDQVAQAARELVQSNGYLPEPLAAVAVRLEEATPQETLEWALGEFGNRIAIATGFGTEGVALIDIAVKTASRIGIDLNVFFLDTGFLFPETYRLREQIETRYGIPIRAFSTALTPELQSKAYGPELWSRDPDLCCRLRKVEPLKDALAGLDAWMTAIRRDQTPARAGAGVVEWDTRYQLVKVNPLARWSKREVWDYVVRNGIPYNPLSDLGYKSIGCTHCTRATAEGEDERAGRWPGHAKTECGLHVAIASQTGDIVEAGFRL